MKTNIFAIIVTYDPDIICLEKNISAVVNQVDKIYIVDNGSENCFDEKLRKSEKIEIILLRENRGIGSAFNLGIELVKEHGGNYVVLLDQDSCLPCGSMELFKSIVIESNKLNICKIASVGPQIRDARSGKISGFVNHKWFFNVRAFKADARNLISADFLISSGSFYPVSIFDEIGMFIEELFIDHVDTEWCLRAISHGYKIFGVSGVVMDHSLGEGDLSFRFFKKFNHPTHKPFRLYYVVRNSLKLYRLPHVTFKWISGDVIRLIRIFLIHAIFSPCRRKSIFWYVLGLLDGLKNAGGKAPKPGKYCANN